MFLGVNTLGGVMCAYGSCLAQGREVVGTEGRGSTAAGTTTSRTATRRATTGTTVTPEATTVTSTTLATIATITTTTTAAAVTTTTLATVTATVTATATATASTGRTVLGRAGVVLPNDGLLGLLVLGGFLCCRSGNKVVLLVLLGQSGALGVVVFDSADLELLELGSGGGLLSEVGIERDLLDLRLLGLAFSVLSVGLGLLGLCDGLTGLLVVQLGLAVGSTPRLGSLLLGAATCCVLITADERG